MPRITGTDDGEYLIGTEEDDFIEGFGGDDELDGAGGDDEIDGGGGNDTIRGGEGADTLEGGPGDDAIFIEDVDRLIHGGAGFDTLLFDLTAYGEGVTIDLRSRDSILGTPVSSIEAIGGYLTDFDDVLIGGAWLDGARNIDARGGYDRLVLDYSAAGALPVHVDYIYIGSEQVRINFLDGTFQITRLNNFEFISVTGTEELDFFRSDSGVGEFIGLGGDDYFQGYGGTYTFYAGDGDDVAVILGGAAAVAGGSGEDVVIWTILDGIYDGGEGSDTLVIDIVGETDDRRLDLSALDLSDPVSWIDELQFTGIEVIQQVELGSGNDTLIFNRDWFPTRLRGGEGFDHVTVDFSGRYADGLSVGGIRFDLTNTENPTGGWFLWPITMSDGSERLIEIRMFESANLTGSNGVDQITGTTGNDRITGLLGNDLLDGSAGVDTAVVTGHSSRYMVTQTSSGIFEVSGPDGTDTLSAFEYLQFNNRTIRLLPGTGVSVNFETADPSVYQSAMNAIRDFDGNDLDGDGAWLRIGSADVNGDGDVDQILVNDAIGRFATVGTADDGLVYFDDYSWAGETRVAGIYVDPLVESGDVVAGSANDSQRRFQNDLQIENINRVLGADDYDGDGLQEVYFALTDGTAYLHAYMHADGNIRYANYQSEQQVIDFLTANGYDSSTWADWFPSSAEGSADSGDKAVPVMEVLDGGFTKGDHVPVMEYPDAGDAKAAGEAPSLDVASLFAAPATMVEPGHWSDMPDASIHLAPFGLEHQPPVEVFA